MLVGQRHPHSTNMYYLFALLPFGYGGVTAILRSELIIGLNPMWGSPIHRGEGVEVLVYGGKILHTCLDFSVSDGIHLNWWWWLDDGGVPQDPPSPQPATLLFLRRSLPVALQSDVAGAKGVQ
eukprot:TRINITY_DN2526_c0_g1_i1.p6 TRINITY_DN2526_c0_g1~~TRINITY_DN2526_c0_g1_i1.p6  ORF type:complete len:123 (+),score=7.11 TRINITY_DN2526_c0_g1_i1:1742-2110(+)